MGLRGVPRTPTAILAAQGSWRAKQRDGTEPVPESGAPSKPADLDPAASAAWDELVPLLESQGTLARIDGRALERYVCVFAWWREARDEVRRDGQLFRTKSREGLERVKPHPAIRLALDYSRELARLELQFGMTPSARASLSASPDACGGEDDPFRCPT